ncbi:MAG: endonuclease MutS2 [Lachnospiraceae bacterium]|nr:endonuclease MutS2 [Lachnospiraceae bacterium]MDY3818046.1 endonuclease MutS2 [Lachnospiraceae bacterium]
MNKKVYRTLEYDKIIEKLISLASSSEAKKRCEQLEPLTDEREIKDAQTNTKDALTRILRQGSVSFSGISDVNASLQRLRLGASLSALELLRVCSLLETTKRLKRFARERKEEEKRDSLDAMFTALDPLTPLQDEIRRCIISEDEIADDASLKLRGIRKNIRGMNDRVHAQLNKMMAQESTRNYLQDAVITMRGDRFCLPVKAEYKSKIPGMVHDQSSSGSTVFIEPLAVVNLNNELKALQIQEQEEIEAILAELSNMTAQFEITIESDYRVLVELDFIFAKAELAKSYNGVEPIFNKEGRIHIRRGRHPLLDPKKVVPIDIRLGEDFDLLIVTGPNTGGKTVSLKTVGLLTLMGQAGLHIPAADRSELSIFHDVFADIGDEQSIEQNLSTFSSHMTNIIHILEHVDEHCLVLFDELCAGTDPTEGAALAISILDDLHHRGVRAMATTHYSEIKVYALSTEGVENACCEFDVETLSPTYRLLIGIPGKSNAFAISGKLGLPSYLIEDAKTRITSGQQSFEDLIADLEASRVTIEKERAEIEQYKAKNKNLNQQLAKSRERLEASKDRVMREANEQAAAILQEAKSYADTTIRNFQKYGSAMPDMKEMEQQRAALREEIGKKQQKATDKKKKQDVNHKPPKKLKIGDSVRVLSMNLTGTVHTLPDAKGNLFVQMGILRSQVNINDLVLIDENADVKAAKKRYEKTGSGKIKMTKSATVSTEIMLIGKTVDEAIAELDKYLDDALMANMPSVRIVHGKGTGALRNAVHQHLKRLKYVEEFHLGEFGEGDAGVTIAKLK